MTRENDQGNLQQLMQMMMEMRAEDRKAERDRENSRLEREDRRQELEARREEEREARQIQLITTLREAQPAVPQSSTIQNTKLPEMKEADDMELFIAMFEAALRSNNIPMGQWKNKLHAHLSLIAKTSIQTIIQDNNSTYDEVKEALLGCSALTFSSAAEDLCTEERGRLLNLEPHQTIDKMIRLAGKVASEAEDKQDILNCMGVALTSNWLVPLLKSYVDMTRKFEVKEYIRTIEEWERSQPVGTPCFKRTFSGYQQTTMVRQNSNPYQPKKPVTCFHCGKPGHISRECRSRLAAEKPNLSYPVHKPVVQTEMPAQTQNPQTPVPSRPIKKEVTCFTCSQKGHKSPQCPQKVNQVRKAQMPSNQVVSLKDNELFGAVGDHCISVTSVTGADITISVSGATNSLVALVSKIQGMDLEITTAAALRDHSRGHSSPKNITALPSNRTVNTSIELINTSIKLINTSIETHAALAFSFIHAL